MSLVWKLDPENYGVDGLVSLYRGDDWSLAGKLVDLIQGYERPVDTSLYSASGFFPSASGGPDLLAPAATGACGAVVVTLDQGQTPNVALSSGQGAYVVVADSGGKLTTVPTSDQAVAVLDRGPLT